MIFFVLSFFPRGVLDEILNLIESVSEDFPSYSYIKNKRGINLIDGIDTGLISTSVIMANAGLIVPVMLPLKIAAIICRSLGACVN